LSVVSNWPDMPVVSRYDLIVITNFLLHSHSIGTYSTLPATNKL